MLQFDIAKAARAQLVARVDEALEAFAPFEAMRPAPGRLIPDEVKRGRDYQVAKGRLDGAMQAYRDFNGMFVKRFKKELAAERKARYL